MMNPLCSCLSSKATCELIPLYSSTCEVSTLSKRWEVAKKKSTPSCEFSNLWRCCPRSILRMILRRRSAAVSGRTSAPAFSDTLLYDRSQSSDSVLLEIEPNILRGRYGGTDLVSSIGTQRENPYPAPQARCLIAASSALVKGVLPQSGRYKTTTTRAWSRKIYPNDSSPSVPTKSSCLSSAKIHPDDHTVGRTARGHGPRRSTAKRLQRRTSCLPYQTSSVTKQLTRPKLIYL